MKTMKRLAPTLFVSSWLLCCCTIETIFDGGLPFFTVCLVTMGITAWAIVK